MLEKVFSRLIFISYPDYYHYYPKIARGQGRIFTFTGVILAKKDDTIPNVIGLVAVKSEAISVIS